MTITKNLSFNLAAFLILFNNAKAISLLTEEPARDEIKN
jgi:hypothetical protein